MRVTNYFSCFAGAFLNLTKIGEGPLKVQSMIDSGEIIIGQPPTKPGQRAVLIDYGQRWAII